MNARLLIPALCIALGLTVPALADDGVRYLAGGVTGEEREQMERLAEGFTLRLVLTQDGGAYLSDAHVDIHGEDGRLVLTLAPDGPWVLVMLPAGRYTVSASRGAVQRQQPVDIVDEQQQRLVFRFPAE